MAKVIVASVLMGACLAAGSSAAQEHARRSVVFVCEHGSVKSVIAAQWFNRLSVERGLRLRGVSRGVDPDESIPAAVADNLRRDGFDLTGVSPARLRKEDLTHADRVVAIGARSPLFDVLAEAPERWDDIPPASTDYKASRDAMRQRIEMLLDRLVGGGGGNPLAAYLQGVEVQAEPGHEANICRALGDLASLGRDELRRRRYADYQGTPAAWDLRRLLHAHFVPDSASKSLPQDEEFWSNVDDETVRSLARRLHESLRCEGSRGR